MKKAIFIVSVVFFLAGCKKEKIEPVEVTPDETNATGKYDQPKFAEITHNDFKFKLDFSYNSEGLVNSINSTIDTLRGTKSEKDYEIKYEYQNDLVSKISFKSYPNAFLEFAEPELENESEVNYVYEGSVVKQMNYKNNIKIDKTEQYKYFYNLDGNVDYILIKSISQGNTQFTDSVNYIYTKNDNTQIVTQEEFKNTSFFDPKGLTPKDTGANGFVRFDRPRIHSFNDIEHGSENEKFTYSKVEKRLQKEVEQQILGYIGIAGTQIPVFSQFIKPYYTESRSEVEFESRNIAFDYQYKVNDKGQLINFTPKQVGMPNSINSFEHRTVKITY